MMEGLKPNEAEGESAKEQIKSIVRELDQYEARSREFVDVTAEGNMDPYYRDEIDAKEAVARVAEIDTLKEQLHFGYVEKMDEIVRLLQKEGDATWQMKFPDNKRSSGGFEADIGSKYKMEIIIDGGFVDSWISNDIKYFRAAIIYLLHNGSGLQYDIRVGTAVGQHSELKPVALDDKSERILGADRSENLAEHILAFVREYNITVREMKEKS